jgi:myo-inositol-1(or 4)-monophosphatase
MHHTELNLVEKVTPIIKNAGDILLSYFNTHLERVEKPGDHGFVTQADLSSEKYLIEHLSTVIPGASFFAEESGKTGVNKEGYCWVIDPLDGTTNFAHGLPYFCISVALTLDDKPVFGMILNPITQELFWAELGKGSYLNGKRMQVSSSSLAQGVIALGLPYAKSDTFDYLLARTLSIAHEASSIRHLGAVALDAAYVAAGKIEGMFFENLGWWDIAAGMLLIHEAGGVVTDFQGKKITPEYVSCIAGAPQVHALLQELLKQP